MSLVELAPVEALKTFLDSTNSRQQELAIQSVLTVVTRLMPTGEEIHVLSVAGVDVGWRGACGQSFDCTHERQVDAIRGHHEDKRVATT